MPNANTIKIKEAWKEAFDTPRKKLRLIGGSVIIFTILACMPIFFNDIQKREGPVLNDFILAAIPPHNVSVAIFIFIWGTGLLILYRALYKPSIYITYCWGLIFVCLLRLTAIYLVALDPPRGLIPLTDPLTGVFYGQSLITKDLFFSGHISTVTLMLFSFEKKRDKQLAFISVVCIAILLLVQHIHYTVDILAAPFFTYFCYWFTKKYIMYF